MSYNFFVSSNITFGTGALAALPGLLRRHGLQKVLVVYDRGVKAAGIADRVLDILRQADVEAVIFDRVIPNPTGETVTVGSLLSFGLSIRGWYERTDSLASRDNVRVTATLLGDLRPTIEFSMSNALEGVKLKLSTIRGEGLPFDHVQGGQPFRVNGVGLDLVEGDTVVAKAVTLDGDVVEAACVVTSAEEDRLDAILPAVFGASALVGRAVSITITSHCGDPTATPDIRSISATIDAAAPSPVPTNPTVTAINGGGTFYAGDNRIEGTNIRFADAHPASHIVLKNGEGQAVTGVAFTDQGTASETEFHVIVADNEGTLADGADYTWEFAMVDSQGNPVTVTKTARWVSE